MIDFVHLHLHSQYSKFDGFSSIEGIVRKAKELKMPAVALTDHGTVAGAIHLLKLCRKEGIKPILGMETYTARNHLIKTKDRPKDSRHLNVFAKNLKGYQNLCALSHTASLDGYYYHPRIDFELLERHKEGLIITSACLGSVINWNLSVERYDYAKRLTGHLKDIFKDDFYLEIMYHGIDKQAKIIPDIIRLGQETNTKIVATNDSHYLEKEDAEFQQVLMCMSSGRSLRDPKRPGRFPYNEFYFKSAQEMWAVFGVESFLLNTMEVAEKCDYSDIIFGTMKLPKFDLPEEFKSPFDYVVHLAKKGLKARGWDKSPKHVAQLKQELSDVKLTWDTKRYDFSTYFLIIEDIISYARKKGIDAGVRGSGYGSVLLHCMGIAEGLDPLSHGLLFGRFLGYSPQKFICENDFGVKLT